MYSFSPKTYTKSEKSGFDVRACMCASVQQHNGTKQRKSSSRRSEQSTPFITVCVLCVPKNEKAKMKMSTIYSPTPHQLISRSVFMLLLSLDAFFRFHSAATMQIHTQYTNIHRTAFKDQIIIRFHMKASEISGICLCANTNSRTQSIQINIKSDTHKIIQLKNINVITS